MNIGEALFVIRRFLDEHNADEKTMEAWNSLRDGITKMIGEMLKSDE